jgi:nucleotide-binding universal stress UspA family protein
LQELEAVVINHILVPLDGSALAECVLPHVLAIAPVTKAHVTLIHVLEHPENRNGGPPIDPMGWHMQKQESQAYLEKVVEQLQKKGLDVSHIIVEGNSAESIIDFARTNMVDLIVLSTHGRTGLSGWNVSSVVQKVLLRSYRSILLIRAYATEYILEVKYNRLFVASDCSARGEYILPFAISMAQFHKSLLILGTVVERPQIIQRLPPSEEEVLLTNQLTERNQRTAARYHEQMTTQLLLKGIEVETHVAVADHAISALHDMVDEVKADLVMLVAHGDTGERRWPYGSRTASLIAHGKVPLMIIQDLSDNDVLPTPAEQAIGESRGH